MHILTVLHKFFLDKKSGSVLVDYITMTDHCDLFEEKRFYETF